MDKTLWTSLQPILAQGARDGLRLVGASLATHGFIQNGAGVEAFIGAGMTLAGLFWGWWITSGYLQAGALLQKLTASKSKGEAVEKAQAMPPADASTVNKAIVKGVTGALLVAFALSFLVAVPSAQAQIKLKSPQQIVRDIQGLNSKATAAVTGKPAVDPATPLPCDFKMLIKLTPDNLVPTIKSCLSDVNSQLVSDTQRALDSAKAYGGTTSGDGDGINCLTPALAIFKAGVQVPAVVAADGTVTTPAQDPGPILLYQKYREFTLSGALTACQAWFNGPINSTAAAGVAGIASAVAGAAILAPK